MCQYNAYLCTAFQKSSVEKRKNRHKLILIMKAKVSLKKLIVSSLFLTLGVSAFAFQNNDFVYNSKEVNGLKVSQSVYKKNNNLLSNYLEYHFKYDDQQRIVEHEAVCWDENQKTWKKVMCVRYAYDDNQVTTSYYKWSNRKGCYVEVPEKTVTMYLTAR